MANSGEIVGVTRCGSDITSFAIDYSTEHNTIGIEELVKHIPKTVFWTGHFTNDQILFIHYPDSEYPVVRSLGSFPVTFRSGELQTQSRLHVLPGEQMPRVGRIVSLALNPEGNFKIALSDEKNFPPLGSNK